MTIAYHRHCPVSDSYDIPMSIVRRAIFSLSGGRAPANAGMQMGINMCRIGPKVLPLLY